MNRCHRPTGAIEIHTAVASELPAIRDLAHRIWRVHYPPIIGTAQTEYMLAQRYSVQTLASAVATGELRYEILTVDGESIAFAGHAAGEAQDEWKLRQLYVLPEWQRRGLGARLIRHVEAIALASGRTTLVLTVNRGNSGAIEAYRRAGFAIRCAADFDIGGGFRMEDFVMAKDLSLPLPQS